MNDDLDKPLRSPLHPPSRVEDHDVPPWIALSAEGQEDAYHVSCLWNLLIGYVANTANESGFFAPGAVDWLTWSGQEASESLALSRRLEGMGALRRVDDRLYVVDWRETYRVPNGEYL